MCIRDRHAAPRGWPPPRPQCRRASCGSPTPAVAGLARVRTPGPAGGGRAQPIGKGPGSACGSA
eukprot:11614362-Alexandrium_andersonii.AAC.1